MLFIPSAVISLIALLLLRRLSPEWMRGWRTWAFVAVGVALHVGWALMRGRVEKTATALSFAIGALTSTWLAAMMVCFFVGGPIAIVAWVLSRRRRNEPAPVLANPARRQFLGAALPVTAASVGVGGTAAGLVGFDVRHEVITLSGLPAALDGFRIGQITDVHIGDFVDPEYLRSAVEAMNAAGVDLQVMTGDLIDDLSQLDETMRVMEACTARHGLLAILGNHEIFRGRDRVIDAYRRSAARSPVVKLLVDESTVLEHNGAKLRVVGVDYPIRRGGPRAMRRAQRDVVMKEIAERAFAGLDPRSETTLCLAHHPEFFNFASERGVMLTLAGHTHGGQVALLRQSMFGFVYDYMLGQYRRGDSKLYVSGGTGHWFPFRMGVPAEVTIITLRAKA